MRLGVVLTQARVLLRLRGREERDYHEEHAIQHGEPRACVAFATKFRAEKKTRNRRDREILSYIYLARTRSHTAEDTCERQLTINPYCIL